MKPQDIARRLRPIIEKAAISLEDELALQAVELFPHWDENSHSYYDGLDGEHPQDKVSYNDVLYKCVQSHTSQASWDPVNAVSLWARVLIPDPEVIPDWVQPESTNPYMTGDKVRHNGKIWESTIDNNVWEPGVYGWSEAS